MGEEQAVPQFDFSQFETKSGSNAGFELSILNPSGDPSGLYVTILGQDSNAYQSLKTKFDRKRLTIISKVGRAAAMGGVFDSGKAEDMEITIACIKSWRAEDDSPVRYKDASLDDPGAIETFFTECPVVYDQVRVAIHDRANFTKASA